MFTQKPEDSLTGLVGEEQWTCPPVRHVRQYQITSAPGSPGDAIRTADGDRRGRERGG
jgi:hypothetical protein